MNDRLAAIDRLLAHLDEPPDVPVPFQTAEPISISNRTVERVAYNHDAVCQAIELFRALGRTPLSDAAHLIEIHAALRREGLSGDDVANLMRAGFDLIWTGGQL
jgi:hypothetical protein